MFLPHIAKRAAAAAAESSAVVPAAAAVPAVPVQPLPIVANTAAAAAAVTTAEPVPDIPAAEDSAEDSAPQQRPAVVVCEDCGRRHSAMIPETVPAFPIQLKICNCDGRGASLQYSPNGEYCWHSVSYHATAVAAAAEFLDLPHFKDTEPDHYRIKCSAAEIEPEPELSAADKLLPIVADNWKTLRSGDVDRLIQTAIDMGIQDSILAAISAERPDLSAKAMREMEYYLAELRESQWKPEQQAPPSADFLEPVPAAATAAAAADPIELIHQAEAAVLRFGKQLEANRCGTIAGIDYSIRAREDSTGFVLVRDEHEIVSGRYGFTFDTFDRTVCYAVQDARQRLTETTTTTNGSTIVPRWHKRRGNVVFLVLLPDHLGAKRFEAEETRAKRFGGWYSREYRPEYVPGGFLFESRESAAAFAEGFRCSSLIPAVAKMPPNSATPAGNFSARDDKSVGDKLRSLADGMTRTIADKLRPLSQNWTPKRGRELATRRHEGENLERCQRALICLADCWERGTVPDVLLTVRTKAAVLEMVSTRGTSQGYYDYRDTGEFKDNSAAAVALRQLMQDSINDGLADAMKQRKRDNEIAAAVNELRKCDNDGFFPTPAALAAEVAEVADLPRTPREDFLVLEPSAGIGSLCDAVLERSPSVKITAVERLIDAAAICEMKGYWTVQGDFFDQSPAVLGTFDRIVMNPPFENRKDIDHVRHAWDFLKPGGRLVAIMSESAFTGSILKQVEFREWLESETIYSTHERKEAFAERDAFRRTGVAVRILIADKRGDY